MTDPYVYEGTDVLVNHFGIRDEAKLEKVERLVTEAGVWRQLQADPPAWFDFGHLLKVHADIFGEIYPFAGEVRTVTIRKPEAALSGRSVDYAAPEVISALVKASIRDMANTVGDHSWAAFSEAVAGLWRAHAFREGNTRAVLVFLHQFCRTHGREIDFEVLSRSPQDTRDALALAASGVPERLASRLAEARKSARRRNHSALGRITAQAADLIERQARVPVFLAQDGSRVRGQVACVSYSTVIAETAKGIVGLPLESFLQLPAAGDRFDVIARGAGHMADVGGVPAFA